jgi:hypothetical protein
LGIAVLTIVQAAAQGRPMSDEDTQAIRAFQLTLPKAHELIGAMTEMTKYVASRPDAADRIQRAMKMTHAAQVKQMETDPQAMAIASGHGLTAHDYVYGVIALRMALLSAQGVDGAPAAVTSPANLAFAKANLAQLKPKMDAADGVRARR